VKRMGETKISDAGPSGRRIMPKTAGMVSILIGLILIFAAVAYTTTYFKITEEELQKAVTYCREYPVTLKVAGQVVSPDVPPVIVKGRTMVPARALYEGVGADIEWKEEDRQVEISMGDSTVLLTIDSRTAVVNGKRTVMDVPPLIIEGRTMIPVRFAAESLGFEVLWDDAGRTVQIMPPDEWMEGGSLPAQGFETGEVVKLPDALASGSGADVSAQLEAYLNSCSNKTVIFPAGRTFILERQLVIHDVENLEIDFNGCLIRLPSGCSWKTRYDTGLSVAISAVTIHDAKNIAIRNYSIDGNSAHISSDQWCVGLWLQDVENFISQDGSFRNSNYHQIVIYGGTRNIQFRGTIFRNHGGATGGAGVSDVFVHNDPNDDFSFIGVRVDNTALKDGQGQCFYIAGYNGYFEDVSTNNCAVPLDIRYGAHVARDFRITNAENVLILQPYPYGNGNAGYARLTASDFSGENIRGSRDGAAGLYIIGCERCHLENFDIDMDTASDYSWYGVRIRKYYSRFPVNDVQISNSEISNASLANVSLESLDRSTAIRSITVSGAGLKTFGVQTASCTAKQYVEDLTAVNCAKYSSEDKMLVLQ